MLLLPWILLVFRAPTTLSSAENFLSSGDGDLHLNAPEDPVDTEVTTESEYPDSTTKFPPVQGEPSRRYGYGRFQSGSIDLSVLHYIVPGPLHRSLIISVCIVKGIVCI